MTQVILTASSWLNISSIGELFSDWRRRASQKRLQRRTYDELSRLTDRELNDIGLGRSDIRSVSIGTFHNEATKTKTESNNNLEGWV